MTISQATDIIRDMIPDNSVETEALQIAIIVMEKFEQDLMT